METPKLEVLKTKQSLKCIFTEQEILKLGKHLAEKTARKSQIEAEKKTVSKQFDAQIAEVEAQIEQDTSHIQSGYEYRNIDCTVTYGEPDATQKTVRRMDTGEIVEVVTLNGEEMQRKLNFEREQRKATADMLDAAVDAWVEPDATLAK